MTCRRWPPPRRQCNLIVTLPGSVLSTEGSLEAATFKAGFIARALAVYRVDEVAIHYDPATERRHVRLLKSILNYLAIPPHLRKKAVPRDPRLSYVGVLPPLRTPLHDAPHRIREGMTIAGLVERCREGVCKVYIGKPGYVSVHEKLRRGEIVVVKITSISPPEAVVVEDPGFYTGYRVTVIPRDGLGEWLSTMRKNGYKIIGTSVRGECRTPKASGRRGVVIVFGGPKHGISDYVNTELIDEVVNVIPFQGTRTVRTEEAIHGTLAQLKGCR